MDDEDDLQRNHERKHILLSRHDLSEVDFIRSKLEHSSFSAVIRGCIRATARELRTPSTRIMSDE